MWFILDKIYGEVISCDHSQFGILRILERKGWMYYGGTYCDVVNVLDATDSLR